MTDVCHPNSHLGAVQRAQRFVSAAADLPQRGAEAPAVSDQAQFLGVLDALGRHPRDPVHQDWTDGWWTGGRGEEQDKLDQNPLTRGRHYRPSSGGPTFPGQHGDADARVAELDEGQAARGSVLLPDQQDVLGADVAVDQVLVLLLGSGAEP